MTSVAIFGLNEVARLTMRSRKFIFFIWLFSQRCSSWRSKMWHSLLSHQLFCGGIATTRQLMNVLSNCGVFIRTELRRVLEELPTMIKPITETVGSGLQMDSTLGLILYRMEFYQKLHLITHLWGGMRPLSRILMYYTPLMMSQYTSSRSTNVLDILILMRRKLSE